MADGGFWKPASVGWQDDARNQDDVGVSAAFVRSRAPLAQQRMMLPIYGHRKHILYAVEKHSVVVIVGETGSATYTYFVSM